MINKEDINDTIISEGNAISSGMSRFLADEIARDILEKNAKYDLVDFVPSEDKVYPCTGCAIRDICDGIVKSDDSYIESLIYVCIEHENKTVILKGDKND